MLKRKIENAPFGLIIPNLNCADINSEVATEIGSLVREHQLLVFPGQNHLTPAEEVAFHRAVNTDCHSIWRDQVNNPWEKYKVAQGNRAGTYQIPDEPGVLVLGKGEIDHCGLKVTLGGDRSAYGNDVGSQVLGGGALQWHIDGTFYEHHPCRMTQMFCVEAPSAEGHWIEYNDGSNDRIWCAAGATAFASGRVAFEALPTGEKQFCLNTRVHYASRPFQTAMHFQNSSNGLRALDSKEKDTAHNSINSPTSPDPLARVYPLVWSCQQTGKQALMPHPRCLGYLETNEDGDGKIQSTAVSRLRIEALMRPAISPTKVYVHPWKPGDLVLWNNHSVWHSATGQLSDQDRRIMHLTAFNADSPPVCVVN